ncbi:MAG TPA: heme-binding protein [Sphingobium sp.]|uniref:heme-binding protein n=1 Tax=Sphingobium sp. TaxID=1912891 RepID=UPI002ED15280
MRRAIAALAASALILSSCGGDGSDSGTSTSTVTPDAGRVYVSPSTSAVLNASDVQTVLSQAVAEAQSRGAAATIAVTDRVGNVLAIYAMAGAAPTAHIPEAPDGSKNDAQGLDVPGAAAAIAKAITGAYLSSSGNAFSTRTASEIVQEHFPPSPSAGSLPGGPLFGVQFSQLPCSDLSVRFGASPTMGPKRSPLGLAADPGGFPLYKNGVVVGGVGVMADGVYGFDPNAMDVDTDLDEYIALAATQGYEAPVAVRADRINVGVSLIYSDADYAKVRTRNAALVLTNPSVGTYAAVPGYYTGLGPIAGTPYGITASGFRPAGSDYSDPDIYVLTNADGTNRYPPIPASDGAGALTQAEVTAILEEAFKVLRHTRAAIRQPIGSRAEVTISVVDRNGRPLGIVRSPDAPIFGTDVSLQKARTAAFFSSATAGSVLSAQPGFAGYVQAFRDFLAKPDALTGTYAFGDRSIGSLARPLFPDGTPNTPHGPLSLPISQFNPFSTGLQSGLIIGNLAEQLAEAAGGPPTSSTCTFTPRLANGIQIFPGSVPIYRGSNLIGAIGVSGDGVDQDDMIGYLGLTNAGVRLGSASGVANAPLSMRSNTLSPPAANGAYLFFVRCPNAPFVDTNDQNVCPDIAP